jgi:hypothetical protein
MTPIDISDPSLRHTPHIQRTQHRSNRERCEVELESS